MEPRNVPVNNEQIVQPVAPLPQPRIRSNINEVTDFLLENCRIGSLKTSYDKHRRYVVISANQIYQQLTHLYAPLFLSYWHHFKRFMEAFPAPAGINPWMHAARAYISVWIMDLYTSNREAIQKLSPLAFQECYQHETAYYSDEYDDFLVLLNATLRPTHIKGTPEDTLYVPLVANPPDWNPQTNDGSPFAVVNFNLDYDLFKGLLGIMKERRNWRISKLVTNTIGRPGWLFDWHTDNRCCAWFPMEGNYAPEDITLAYIIGAACSPKLGPRDVDDWQDWPDQIRPAEFNMAQLDRAVQRRFYGAYEVRTISHRRVPRVFALPTETTQAKRPRKGKDKATQPPAQQTRVLATTGQEPADAESVTDVPQESGEITELVDQYQIIDWNYYNLVVLNLEPHTRGGALKMLATT